VTNKLFYGDNLDVLRRKIESGSMTVASELFAPHNRCLDLPMAPADAVKAASAMRDEDKQESLF